MQIHLIPIAPGLLSPAATLFSRPIKGLISKLSRTLILFNHDDDHYAALIERKQNADKDKDTCKKFSIFVDM